MKPNTDKKHVSKNKIITSFTGKAFTPPTEEQWDILQSRLGSELSPDLRLQLSTPPPGRMAKISRDVIPVQIGGKPSRQITS